MKPNIGISDANLKSVNQLLNTILANQHVLYIKTRKYHWNVSGPNFKEYHEFFEEQYTQLEMKIDEVAERIRTLGGTPVATMVEFIEVATLQEDRGNKNSTSTKEMMGVLLKDHEQTIREMREDIDKCEEAEDVGTADFLTGLMEDHEKMAWMLRKYIE
jgi:starvation-inducible DNA-binding protein